MLSRLNRWINDRWPLKQMISLGLEEEVTGGASFAYSLGSAVLFIFGIQVLTGVWQLFYYVPTTDHAYDSVNYLRAQVPFGWLIHNLHYWGANAMVIMVVLHMSRVFIWGAYKNPRELTWLLGVGLFFLTMGMSFTGAPLPWDELGYWALEVGTSIAGTVPLVGIVLKNILRGGDAMDQLTISRMFVIHVAILPAFLMALVGAHLVAFRAQGNVGPWREEKRRVKEMFWPAQMYKDTVLATLIFLIMLALCAFVPPPFSGPADPLDTTYHPKPEWNFLFLYQALKFFPGDLEFLGTVGIPLLGLLAMLALPFIDRRPERNPFRRPFMMAIGFLVASGVIALTILGAYSKPEGVQGQAQRPGQASSAPPSGQHISKAAMAGEKLFHSQGCIGCHQVNGTGGTTGPELSGDTLRQRSDSWIKEQIRNPQSHFPSGGMPAFSALSDQQLDDLLVYLRAVGSGSGGSSGTGDPGVPASGSKDPPGSGNTSVAGTGTRAAPSATADPSPSEGEKSRPIPAPKVKGVPGEAASMIGNPSHGAEIYQQKCESCHGFKGKDDIPNPGSDFGKVPPLNPVSGKLFSKDPKTFAGNIDVVIQRGAVPKGPDPSKIMPAFGDTNTLSQQEIAEVEAYILALNGVDRAELLHPGMHPKKFFFLVLGLFVLAALVAEGFRLKRRRHPRGQA